jgi:surface antigen
VAPPSIGDSRTVRARASSALFATCLAVVVSTSAVPPASASAFNAAVKAQTQKQSGSTLASAFLGWMPLGGVAHLNCYVCGQAVRGYYSPWIPNGGWDNIWYKTDEGFYVADVDISTNSNSPVAPACSSSTTDLPIPGRATGRKSYVNLGVAGNCTWGAYNKWYNSVGGYYPALAGNAKDWRSSARANGWTVVDDAQARSIVVFQPGVQGAGSAGHVAWVDSIQRRGDGTYVSITEMNYGGALGVWHLRTLKDVAGMSYILAP